MCVYFLAVLIFSWTDSLNGNDIGEGNILRASVSPFTHLIFMHGSHRFHRIFDVLGMDFRFEDFAKCTLPGTLLLVYDWENG